MVSHTVQAYPLGGQPDGRTRTTAPFCLTPTMSKSLASMKAPYVRGVALRVKRDERLLQCTGRTRSGQKPGANHEGMI